MTKKAISNENLVGQRFKTLEVVKFHHNVKASNTDYWTCICQSCGDEHIVSTGKLRSGQFRRCCYPGIIPKDLTGQRFGKLVVVGLNRRRWNRKDESIRWWICDCDCGRRESIAEGNLITKIHRRFQCTVCSRKRRADMVHRDTNPLNTERDTTAKLKRYLKKNPHYWSSTVDMRSAVGIAQLWGEVIKGAYEDGEDYTWLCKLVGISPEYVERVMNEENDEEG